MSTTPTESGSDHKIRPLGRRARRVLSWLAALAVLVTAAGGWVIYQHDYAIREEQVTITGGKWPLKGVLAWPDGGRGPHGLVVFVHGDGPMDARHSTFYRPMWEAFAKAGYASLAWNKPGVGGAPGDWLAQTMDDRAAETIAAITWAKRHPGIDARRIGLWGASQAGWVMPKVAVHLPDLRFVIAVSTAINWVRQGRYNLLAELKDRGATPAEVRAEVARSDERRRLMREGASYEEYKAAVGAEHPLFAGGLTAARWRFAVANHTSDASKDLAAMRVPVLLMLGGRDLNVDVAESEAGYRQALREPGLLQVKHYPDAAHEMVPKDVKDSSVKSFLLAVAAPRSLFTTGFLDDQRRYLERIR